MSKAENEKQTGYTYKVSNEYEPITNSKVKKKREVDAFLRL